MSFRSRFAIQLQRASAPRNGIAIARRMFVHSPIAFNGPKVYPGEWARQPPPKEDEEVEFTIKVPKPIRPVNEPIETMRARLQWMSRKRGILETDLLLSTFANKHLKTMSHQALKEYDDLLEENDWDIYYWATGARKPPANVKAMLFWDDLFEHCKNSEKIVLRMPDALHEIKQM